MPPRHKLRSVALRLSLVAGSLCLLGSPRQVRADATDVSLLYVKKTQFYRQIDGSSPVRDTNGFGFEAGAVPTGANRITSAQLTPPGGAPKVMTNIGGGTFLFDGGRFATQAALDAAFPNGSYGFSLQTVTGTPTYNDSITTGNLYPANVPTQQNGTWSSGALQVDATKLYPFNWNDVSPFVSPNQMVFEIRDAAGAVVFTRTLPPDPSGFAINLQMAANTLQPGAYYTATLAFERRVVTTVSPTLTKVSIFATKETFKIATISAVPGVTGPSNPLGTVGQLFVYQIIASNHPFSYSASALPAGLTLDSNLGIISGVPTAGAVGTTPATLSATNVDGVGTKTNYATVIQAAPTAGPVIVSSTCAHYFSGRPFKFQIVTKNATPAARISATGLPAGLVLDAVTGTITGTTTAVGSFSVNLSVRDGNFTASGFLQLTFTADAAYPVITNADTVLLPKNQPFSYQIATPGAVDPNDPVSYNMLGALPVGLGFNPATGVISGTYTGPVAPTGADDAHSPDAPTLTGGALLGSIQLFGTNSHGTSTFQLLFLSPPSGAVNISTRVFVGTGDSVLIGGFIVTGNAQKVVIIRAIGPSTGVPGALQDPILELHDSHNNVVINDNWRATQEQLIKDSTVPPLDDRESAIVIALDPGNYTAIVSGKNGATGIALVEAYDLGTASLDPATTARLAQISTRGNVLTGDNVMIGGFFISGVQTKIITRAIGPSLTGFGVANALQDPNLELHDGNGTTLRSNDSWKIREDGSSQQAEVEATTVPPSDDRESAIVQTLTPGPYTAIVRGKGNTTGVALAEVFALP